VIQPLFSRHPAQETQVLRPSGFPFWLAFPNRFALRIPQPRNAPLLGFAQVILLHGLDQYVVDCVHIPSDHLKVFQCSNKIIYPRALNVNEEFKHFTLIK
jgi:hypothetical protein